MRRWVVLSFGMLFCLSGCILVGTYDYGDYDAEATGGGSSSSSSNASSTGSGSGSSSSTGGMGGQGGMSMCPPPVCDDGIDVPCQMQECHVSGELSRVYNAPGHQAIKAIATNATGGIAIGGNYGGTLDFDGHIIENTTTGNLIPFVARFGEEGVPQFADHILARGATYGVAMDSAGTIYGTGILEDTVQPPQPPPKKIFVKQFGTSGWQHDFGMFHVDNESAGIAYGGDSRLYVAGRFNGAIDTSCPNSATTPASNPNGDSFVMEFDSAGKCSWVHLIAKTILRSIVATSNLIVVGGIYSGQIALPGAPDISTTASFYAVFETLTNHTRLRQGYLVPETGTISLVNVAIDPDNHENVYITAKFNGSYKVNNTTLKSTVNDTTSDLLVAKMDKEGNALWAQRFGGPGAQVPNSITPFKGGIFVSGTTDAEMAIERNSDKGTLCMNSKCMFLLKLSPDTGLPMWGRAFGDSEMADDPTAVGVANDVAMWLGGGWSSAINFGDNDLNPEPPAPSQDLVLTRFTNLP